MPVELAPDERVGDVLGSRVRPPKSLAQPERRCRREELRDLLEIVLVGRPEFDGARHARVVHGLNRAVRT